MNDEANVVSTLEETDRKCPACGGTMDFNPKTGGLKCPYCDYEEEIKKAVVSNPEADASDSESAKELNFEEAENTANSDWGVATKTVICKSCGAESVYDTHEIASECPYCGSNQVMEANDSSTMAPGGVVPFKIDQKEAANRFVAWIKGRFFAPKAAKETAKAKNFKGIYLPYWTFDTDTTSTYSGEYGKDRKVKKGDNEEIVTDWYKTSGVYKESFDDELVCGTDRHETHMLNGIEPYNTADNKVYKPEYVAGFAAERYTIGLKAAWEMAKDSIHSQIESGVDDKIRSEHHADHVRNLHVSSRYANITYKYLLLPVWIANYKYKDKVYKFMVNGQTGKVYGKSPVSALKVAITIIVTIIVLYALYYFFMR